MDSKYAPVEGFNDGNDMESYYNAANVNFDEYMNNKLPITIDKVT